MKCKMEYNSWGVSNYWKCRKGWTSLYIVHAQRMTTLTERVMLTAHRWRGCDIRVCWDTGWWWVGWGEENWRRDLWVDCNRSSCHRQIQMFKGCSWNWQTFRQRVIVHFNIGCKVTGWAQRRRWLLANWWPKQHLLLFSLNQEHILTTFAFADPAKRRLNYLNTVNCTYRSKMMPSQRSSFLKWLATSLSIRSSPQTKVIKPKCFASPIGVVSRSMSSLCKLTPVRPVPAANLTAISEVWVRLST